MTMIADERLVLLLLHTVEANHRPVGLDELDLI